MMFIAEDAERVELALPGTADGSVTISWAARSHVGLRREVNEDSVVAQPPIFAVADGMGGHAAGDRASAAVASSLAAAAEEGRLAHANDLDDALMEAAAAIDVISHGLPTGAGTTVTGVLLTELENTPVLLVFNIGDSRVYGLTAQGLSRITVDHSVVQELIDAGMLDPADAEDHPESNIITRSIGFEEDPKPDLWGVAVKAGLRMLICSDGLTREVTDSQIGDLLGRGSAPGPTADSLLDAALSGGGRDNISLIILDVLETVEPERGTMSASDAG